jgi:hypothetical protein
MSDFAAIRFQPQRPLLRELSADRLNTILQEIRRNKPKGERGITVRQSGDGTYIGLAASLPAGKGGAATTRQPWDIYVEDTEGEEGNITYTLKVQPGTLARVLADNYDDEFEANDSDLYYGIARVATDGTYITGVSLNITTNAPSQQEATRFGLPTEIEILFGLFKEGQSINLAGQANIDVRGVNVIVSTPTPAPEPGEPMFDLYFKLQ